MGLRLSPQARREVVQRMASRYQQASASYKKALLDEAVAITGYVRRTAMRLLNHPPQRTRPQKRRRQTKYGPEVQQALFLLWHQANRICTKRLIPFLPTLIEALERHHHLQVSETCRSQLLTMSAATADRLLRSSRAQSLKSPSTTQAGTWLKQQIPLRTFEQWNETQPGFLEIDLVAHCGREARGSFLYTLTLTDIATGWTECLPLRSKNAEELLSAVQIARALFPFPILGVDADNGGEFINEHLLTYCEEEGLTFTRGRPDLKNDQCFVEQKNGAVIRQVVGHERFEGEAVYRQLDEVYQALRLYVNCFQPSMKLLAKASDSKKVCRIYDAAKTPLQRLLLSEVLSASQRSQMQRMAQMLDPLRLFEQLQALQQALFASLSQDVGENRTVSRKRSRHRPSTLTMEQAKGDYLANLMSRHRRPKTLEWHEIALGSLQRYLQTEHQCVLLSQITHTQVDGWLTFLQEQPTTRGSLRSASTVQSYARSARAFCQWMVQKNYLHATPFALLPMPAVEIRPRPRLSLEEWDRLLLACHPPKKTEKRAEQAKDCTSFTFLFQGSDEIRENEK